MKNNSNEIKYLTPYEVAELIKVETTTVYSYRKQGLLIGYHIGRLLRFREDDVISFMESQRDKRLDDKVTDLKVRGV